MNSASEAKMFGAVLVTMDVLEHSDLTTAGKYAALEAARNRGNASVFENAEPFQRLWRALRPLRLSTLQREVVFRVASRWARGEWPPMRSILPSKVAAEGARASDG